MVAIGVQRGGVANSSPVSFEDFIKKVIFSAEVGIASGRGASKEEKGGIPVLCSLNHGHVRSHNTCAKNKKLQWGRITLWREV